MKIVQQFIKIIVYANIIILAHKIIGVAILLTSIPYPIINAVLYILLISMFLYVLHIMINKNYDFGIGRGVKVRDIWNAQGISIIGFTVIAIIEIYYMAHLLEFSGDIKYFNTILFHFSLGPVIVCLWPRVARLISTVTR